MSHFVLNIVFCGLLHFVPTETPLDDVIWSSIETARIQNTDELQTCLVKAKFHYSILAADKSEAGRRPAGCSELEFGLSSSKLAGMRPASDLSATSLGHVCM